MEKTSTKSGAPGFPVWGRGGHVPMYPDGDGGGAAPKPDANQALGQATTKQEPAPVTTATATAAPAAKVDAPAPPAPEKKTEPAAQLDRFAEIERQMEARARSIDEKATALETKLEGQRQKSVIATLRKMGADPDLISDADLLTLAPKVDPDDPAGLAKLVEWKATKRFFRQAEVGPQENLGVLVKAAREDQKMPEHLRERKARMLAKVHGGKQ